VTTPGPSESAARGAELLQIAEDEYRAYASDPLPGWGCRSLSLFDARSSRLELDSRAQCGVFSVPFDSTASSRIGSREGPKSVREASLVYGSQLRSRGVCKLVNTRTGAEVVTRERDLVDFGDGHVYASDPWRQVRCTAAETYRVASLCDLMVLIGGEHTISYPGYCGVAAALAKRGKTRLGYVQIDHHFDFGNNSALHGPYYHGSNARRISEHPASSARAIGFVGAGDLTLSAQLEQLKRAGMAVRTMADIRRQGFETALREVLDQVASNSDALYVSLDIDVCDASVAPGTGHVTIGGLSAYELFTAPAILQEYPLAAFDIMEVSPRYDVNGVTAHVAARFLFELLLLERVHR